MSRFARISGWRLGIAAAVVLAMAPLPQAQAENDPNQPIRIVVPFAPGGSVDILARAVGQKLQEKWAQPILVENRAGGSTMIGTAYAAKAPADGHTLIIVVSNHATNPALYQDIPYDAFASFEPVTLMARAPVVLYSHPSLKATNLTELIKLAKEKSGATDRPRTAGAASRARLPAAPVPVAAQQSAQRRLWRQPRQSPALPVGGVRGGARRLAGQAAGRAASTNGSW
jgi:tripartite-type tricarboxylate transporter receptor subunit TctC